MVKVKKSVGYSPHPTENTASIEITAKNFEPVIGNFHANLDIMDTPHLK